jgi:hypothetical protein
MALKTVFIHMVNNLDVSVLLLFHNNQYLIIVYTLYESSICGNSMAYLYSVFLPPHIFCPFSLKRSGILFIFSFPTARLSVHLLLKGVGFYDPFELI